MAVAGSPCRVEGPRLLSRLAAWPSEAAVGVAAGAQVMVFSYSGTAAAYLMVVTLPSARVPRFHSTRV